MFLKNQGEAQLEYYEKMLKIIGSLSRLFSESSDPYIQYRVAENLFCKSFGAKNHSRSDCSVDASKDGLGVGIKTFLEKNGFTSQKIAEFNGDHISFKDLGTKEKVLRVCEMRNDRLNTTKNLLGLEEMIYHCVTRKNNNISIFETPMELVDIGGIRNVSEKKNVISFNDGINEYAFNVTKSTLYKRFITPSDQLNFRVEILDDPFSTLEILMREVQNSDLLFSPLREEGHVFLPLYSTKNGNKFVADSSGLNQWNAKGRARNENEAYIQIPVKVHKKHPGFFPPRDTSFTLILPDGSKLSAKVCQENSKALMSNPNSALGDWLLRSVLKLSKGELLKYERLVSLGLDSVLICKISEGVYSIDFTKIGSYENFIGDFGEEDDEDSDD